MPSGPSHHRRIGQLLVAAVERIVRQAGARAVLDDPAQRKGPAAVLRDAERQRRARHAPDRRDAAGGIGAAVVLLAELVVERGAPGRRLRGGDRVAEQRDAAVAQADRDDRRVVVRHVGRLRRATSCDRRPCSRSGRRNPPAGGGRRRPCGPPSSGTIVMCTQPVELGHVDERPARAAVGADRDGGGVVAAGPAGAGQHLAEEERQHPGAVVADHDRRPHEAAARQAERARAGPSAMPAGVRSSGRKRTSHSSCRPPGWAVWKRPTAPVVGIGEDHRVLLGARRVVGHAIGRAPLLGAGRERRQPDEDVRLALERAGEPGAGERAVRQPLQERRVVVHHRRRQEGLGPVRRRLPRFARPCAPRSRQVSLAPPAPVR